MIKLIQAVPQQDFVLRLAFSDQTWGELDFKPYFGRSGRLLEPLRDAQYFGRCFLELGALCWPNGLEFSAESLQRRLRDESGLHGTGQAAA